jgi:dUTP pyrophosphatase
MTDLRVAIERLPHGADLPLPAYATAGAAGLDLLAAVPETEPLALEPGRHVLVPTGVRIALPPGHEAQVRPRSGLALRHAVTVLNSPGTIDADYRGEIGVILINLGRVSFLVTRAMRVAQLVVAPVAKVSWDEASLESRATGRGQGGFGSTGVEPAEDAHDHGRGAGP